MHKLTKEEEQLELKNLYQAFISNINYNCIIESYGNDKVTLENCNVELLEAMFAGLYLTLIIDEYSTKISEDEVKFHFAPIFINEMVNMIALDNGKGYTVGDLMYKDASTVLVKIRNKLAHGDFKIKNDNLVYEEHGNEGRINLNDLLKFISNFENEYESYLLYNNRKKKLFIAGNLAKRSKVTSKQSLYETCNDIYMVEITDSPLFPYTRDEQYIRKVKKAYSLIINEIDKNNNPKIIASFITSLQNDLLLDHINFKFNITRLTNLDYYEAIQDKYLDQIEVFKTLPINNQLATITHYAYSLGNDRFQKTNIRKGILLNETVLKEYRKNPNISLKKALENNREFTNLYIYNIDEMILSTNLLCFNSLYEYGLDKTLTNSGTANILEILKNEKLDFAQLDLSAFESDTMKIEKHYTSNLAEETEFKLDEYDRRIKIIEKNMNEYRTKSKTYTQTKIDEFNVKIHKLSMKKLEAMSLFTEANKFEESYDKTTYEKNLNIIYHIRNAIAHGWIYIDAYTNDLREKYMIIRDYDKNKNLVYEKILQMKDFYTLFKVGNLDILHNFYASNIDDKSFVDRNYVDSLIKRTEYRRIKK